MLPVVYCDFLLALYSNGDEQIEPSVIGQNRFIDTIQTLLLSMMIPFSLLVIYFTQFQIILQLSMLILFLGYSIWMYVYLKPKWTLKYHLALMNSLLIALFISVLVSKAYLHDFGLIIIVFINFLFWVVIGFYKKINYLLITGILALVFTCIYIVL